MSLFGPFVLFAIFVEPDSCELVFLSKLRPRAGQSLTRISQIRTHKQPWAPFSVYFAVFCRNPT